MLNPELKKSTEVRPARLSRIVPNCWPPPETARVLVVATSCLDQFIWAGSPHLAGGARAGIVRIRPR